MTSSTNRASLIERLEAEDPFRISNDGMTVAELPPPGKLRNPDGPEAVALIRRYEDALRDISGPVVNIDVAKAVARVALGIEGSR